MTVTRAMSIKPSAEIIEWNIQICVVADPERGYQLIFNHTVSLLISVLQMCSNITDNWNLNTNIYRSDQNQSPFKSKLAIQIAMVLITYK